MNIQSVPVDDELLERFEAWEEATDDRPSIWTPEHVQVRLIEAFDVLMRSGVHVGPSNKTGFWPPVVHEFSDLVDQQARAEAEARGRRVRHRPTSDEASRMDEALEWPMRYLEDPLEADALTLFCLCRAAERDIAPILRRRKVKAMERASWMTVEHNASPANSGRARSREAIAAGVVEWANERLKAAKTPEQKDAIKSEARKMFAADCAIHRCEPIRIAPHEAVPGVCLSRTNLDRMRKRGATAIAKALVKDRIIIR